MADKAQRTLFAQNGHRRRIVGCPLPGEERTSHLRQAKSYTYCEKLGLTLRIE